MVYKLWPLAMAIGMEKFELFGEQKVPFTALRVSLKIKCFRLLTHIFQRIVGFGLEIWELKPLQSKQLNLEPIHQAYHPVYLAVYNALQLPQSLCVCVSVCVCRFKLL